MVAEATSDTNSPSTFVYGIIAKNWVDGTPYWSVRDLAAVWNLSYRVVSAGLVAVSPALEGLPEQIEKINVVETVIHASGVEERVVREDYRLSALAVYTLLVGIPSIAEGQVHVRRYFAGHIAEDPVRTNVVSATPRSLFGTSADTPKRDPGVLLISDYLLEKTGLPDFAYRQASKFGKAMKKAYVAKHGHEPPTTLRELDETHVTEVYSYTQGDRSLFDEVWKNF